MTDDDREGLREKIIRAMNNGGGISVHPALVAVAHGFHPETGADLITFGSYDHRSQHLLTQVMELELARDACDKLTEQIDAVDRLNAAKPNTNGDNQ